jgi:hypothetical protein
MAVTLPGRVPVDEITARARQARPGRAILTAIAAILFALGWLAARTLTGLWLALAWSGTAVKVGWQAGRPPRGGGAVSRGAA